MNDIERLEKFIRTRNRKSLLDISEAFGVVSDLHWLHWHKDSMMGLLIGLLGLELIGRQNPIDTLFGGSALEKCGSALVLCVVIKAVVEVYRTAKLIKIFNRSAIQNANDLITWIKERTPSESAK
ncbi:MAG: hypothetical protein HZC54_21430 [Verrucomicrobia bacterium]|nr:hypothetical protein [Verrucomicrobiota bacterium]